MDVHAVVELLELAFERLVADPRVDVGLDLPGFDGERRW
jgi:hypothetical protein